MRIFRARAGTLRTAVAAFAGATLLLTACSQGDTADGGSGTATDSPLTTVTETMPDQVEDAPSTDIASDDETSPDAETATDEATEPEECESTPVDNPLTGENPVPVRFANSDATDSHFYYTPMSGEPDPCTPLSWVELAGTTGVGGPGATSGSNHETVALFADGELVTEPAPILARSVESVERVDDSTLRVNYAFYNDKPAAANDFTPGSATFHWDGSDIVVSDNTLPEWLNENAATLVLGG